MAKKIHSDLVEYPTVSKYLNSNNGIVKRAVEQVALSVHAAANQAITSIKKSRERISDATDHLDGVLEDELNITQAEEIIAITKIGEELDCYFEKMIHDQIFGELKADLKKQAQDLALREEELNKRETKLENTKEPPGPAAEKSSLPRGKSSREMLESALRKAEKVFDQNKITRFAYSTISRVRREFEHPHEARDVGYLTRIFQETIVPFQDTKIVNDREGKPVSIVVNSFSDSCYQELFFFFCKYYKELLEMYEQNNDIPSTGDELARMFKTKQKGLSLKERG